MYADKVASGAKRSIRDRLDVNLSRDMDCSRSNSLKRQRQSDDRWKHDLYEPAKAPQVSNSKLGPRDLRLKLQKKATNQGGRKPGVRDLREKLSGLMSSQPATVNLLKTKAAPPKLATVKLAPKSAKLVRKNDPSVEENVAEMKKVSEPSTSGKKSESKTDLTVDGLLESLGLEKYLIQFQAEEVDMTALMHMSDDDLKALGVPMGPRKKILLALESEA